MGRISPEHTDFINQTPSGEFWSKPRKRRGFFKTAGQIAFTAALADTAAGELVWGGTDPKISVLPDSDVERRLSGVFNLAIGGFNVSNVQGLGRAVESILPEYGRVAYLQNSSKGIHMGDISREADRFIEENDVSLLRIYGHSMGGMEAIMLADMLKDKVDVEAVMLDCTPASYLDMRNPEQLATWLLHTANEASFHFGPMTRSGLEAIAPLFNGDDSLWRICMNALRKGMSPESCSNKLVQAQASLTRIFNAAEYKNAISQRTHIIRLRPEDYAADPVINNETSLPHFLEGLAHDIIDVAVPGGGHANPGQQQAGYMTALGAAARHCNFYNGKNRSSGMKAI